MGIKKVSEYKVVCDLCGMPADMRLQGDNLVEVCEDLQGQDWMCILKTTTEKVGCMCPVCWRRNGEKGMETLERMLDDGII